MGIKYRPEIDGLRAIAVLGVILFHYPLVPWLHLNGGFLGVDVFFVISGFLISSIVFKQMDRGQWSFKTFYARRILRLAPALLVTLSLSFFIGFVFLFPEEFLQLAKHILGGLSFSSNFILWNEHGYFDKAVYAKPLLHLWSLAIEEQFYLIFPALALLLSRWTQKIQILVLGFLTLVSFFLSAYLFEVNPIAGFFFPLSRAWEIGVGVLLGWARFRRPHWKLSFLGGRTSFIFLALIFLSFALVEENSSHFGFVLLVPVLSTVFLLVSLEKEGSIKKLLSHSVLVSIGLISYPLYLIHWPLYSFSRIVLGGTPPVLVQATSILVSFMISWWIYLKIERPVRTHQNRKTKVRQLGLVSLVVALVSVSVFGDQGWDFRPVAQGYYLDSESSEGKLRIDRLLTCDLPGNVLDRFQSCYKQSQTVENVLIGDSKAQSLAPGIFATSPKKNWLFMGGRLKKSYLAVYDPRLEGVEDSNNLRDIAQNHVLELQGVKNLAIPMTMRSLFGVGGDLFTSNLKKEKVNVSRIVVGVAKYLQPFVDKGIHIFLIMDSPTLPNPEDTLDRPTGIKRLDLFLKKSPEKFYMNRTDFLNRTKVYRKVLLELRRKFPKQVHIVDTIDVYCDLERGLCLTQREGHRLYSYTDHPSFYSSKQVGELLHQSIGKANRH